MKKIPDNAKKVFEGERFSVWQWQQQLFDGSSKIFESVTRNDVSTIITVTDDGKLLFLKEEQSGKPLVYTFPSGTLEENDSPLLCAERELLEETGYKASSFAHWYTKSAGSSVDFDYHIFIAKGAKRDREQKLDPGEKIEIEEKTLEEILEIIEDIKFKNPTLYPILIKAKYSENYRKELKDLLGITT
jgi:ADP-ribose pyrophosphatase